VLAAIVPDERNEVARAEATLGLPKVFATASSRRDVDLERDLEAAMAGAEVDKPSTGKNAKEAALAPVDAARGL